MKGNKGEWSELYALVYLLGTRKLYAADEKLQKLKELYFPILKILRTENKYSTNIDYILKDADKVEIYLNSHSKKMYIKLNLQIRFKKVA